ncbi:MULTISPECIES: zf-HC2 domain-containing protein [Thalassospira]|uniref:Putative zinc-finger domain-containing protein n=1 Tax=Thalassospira profundimaris TaxID=502049 RepID=A0A367V8C4_9PROT|nr:MULTISPECIES: zf-HC2 domain-containing protein [Thalassospira]KZB72247.1 hypothetical protein AUQ43_03735 [Thalassospira sp. MCCC 1A01148]MBR9902125.1 hypothetical protein [Rhodospirillales bacterium]RCK21447.1 hypothetical protein TH6_12575 [Thalassospira profundimaris]
MSTKLEDQDYNLLSAYIDGELSPTECRELEDRIAKCPAMTRQFNIMAGQSVVLRNQAERLLTDRVYPELAQDIEDILDQKKTSAKRFVEKSDIDTRPRVVANNNTPIWTGIGAAAAVLLAFVGGNWFNAEMLDADVETASTGTNVALAASYSPLNNPLLDEEISLTLERTLSGDIRQVSLGVEDTTSETISIEPLRTFRQDERFCREYQVTFPSSATTTNADNFYGRACRTGEGKWETIYRLIPGAKLSDAESELKTKQKL